MMTVTFGNRYLREDILETGHNATRREWRADWQVYTAAVAAATSLLGAAIALMSVWIGHHK